MPTIKETIQQNLAPTNAPYINGVQARLNFNKAVLEAIFQGIIEKDGKGVSNKFVSEDVANNSAQVLVNKLKPHYDEGREHGSAKNGGAFNNIGYMSATETFGIDILQLFDATITIPRATQDRIDVDLAAGEIANYVGGINVAINGSSWAAKWFATYNALTSKRNVVKITSSDISNKLVLQRFIEADALLDAGDLDNDVDAFPMETRKAIFVPTYRPVLTGAGVLVVGGANYGYDIVRNGAVDNQSKRSVDDGFWGVIDGVETHGISNLSLRSAAGFCGMPKAEFTSASHLKGWLSSALANARGVSMVDQVKIVDSIGGQGIILQPITKLGAVCWYPKGNVAITEKDYDPISALKTLFSGVASQLTFKLKSAGSRYYAVESAFVVESTGLTLTASAKDDAGTDHIKASYYVIADNDITSVADFLDATATATYKGSANTAGNKVTTTIGSNKYAVVLVIADDGTCTLISKKA